MKTAGSLFFGLFLALVLPFSAFGQDCFPNGDMNGDAILSSADAIILLGCAFEGINPCLPCGPCPPLPTGDLNCDGWRDMADCELELECVFNSAAPLGPCPIADVRPLGPPDPGDAIIVQPRIIFPAGGGAPYTSLRVWITNKDMLRAVVLPLGEIQTEPPTYAVLSPGDFAVTPLAANWGFDVGQTFYAGLPSGPDPFLIWGRWGGSLVRVNLPMPSPRPCLT